MAIDTSMYGTIQAPQIQYPQPMQMAEGAMRLSQLGMQNQALKVQAQQQQIGMAQAQGVRQAYSDNTDATGNLDRQGFLSDLGKNAYTAPVASDYAAKFTAQDKAQADTQAAQADAASKTLNITGPAFDYMAGLPEDQRAQAWPKVMDQLKQQGVDTSRMDHDYDPQLFSQYLGTWQQSKPALENQLTQANIANTQAGTANKQVETAQVGISKGAEELGKFNEDVNNPSSRKITGSLTDTINRADRIQALANVGAVPGETDQQKIARLNKVTPQLAQEFSASLASIMNGGVPPEELQKKLSPDTIQGSLANLQQKYTSEPTGANQGALLKGYVDAAKQLGDFSKQRLKQISDNARAAYPYAEQYFPGRMDKIASGASAPVAPDSATANSDQISSTSAAPKQATQYRAPGAPVSGDEVAQYATKHGMKLSDAQSFLKSRGYVVNQ